VRKRKVFTLDATHHNGGLPWRTPETKHTHYAWIPNLIVMSVAKPFVTETFHPISTRYPRRAKT
jgi:hypothetical protein